MAKNSHKKAAAAAAEAGASPPAAAAAPGPGMGSSVTPHAQISDWPREWKYLACGIDTLDLGFYVDWGETWKTLEPELDARRDAAQNSNGVLWRASDLGACVVLPRGKAPMYRYHLQLADYHIFIAKRATWANNPNVYVSISSRSLWHRGVRESVSHITQLLEKFGCKVHHVQPSRVDLAADFHVPGGLALEFVRETLVSRSELETAHFGDNRVETMMIGAPNSPIQVRIYDKSKEIIENEKLWFHDIWQTDADADIWRVELQLRRPALKQYGINTIDDVLAKVGGVWNNLTQHWITLRLNDDANTTRRTVHPFWSAVQSAAELLGPAVEVKRDLQATPADIEWYRSHFAGCLLGFAARLGQPDLITALLVLQAMIVEYWRERHWPNEYQCKRIQLGHEDAPKESGDGQG